jgi:hypothetical protein
MLAGPSAVRGRPLRILLLAGLATAANRRSAAPSSLVRRGVPQSAVPLSQSALTEANAVATVVESLALSRPEVGFFLETAKLWWAGRATNKSSCKDSLKNSNQAAPHRSFARNVKISTVSRAAS